jgi:tetrahydromethanopterin S-methyltransferase subunit B
LGWIELALKSEPNNPAYLDTKANILYELGYKEDAIQLEVRALNEMMEYVKKGLDKVTADLYITTLDKMRKGLPTWPNKQ